MARTVMNRQATLLVALTLAVGGSAITSPAYAADKKTRPVCCPNHPASHAKCCESGTKEACCHNPKKDAKGETEVCAITGKPLKECCGKKASQMPPCCQKGCKHAGKTPK